MWLWFGILVALLLVLIFVKPLVAGLYALLAAISLITFTLLDELTSASLLPAAPWVLWMLWGALIGGTLGFWTIAPVFGLRKHRALIAISPFILMAFTGLLRAAFRH